MKVCVCHGIETKAGSAVNYPSDIQIHICAISGRACDVEEITESIEKILE